MFDVFKKEKMHHLRPKEIRTFPTYDLPDTFDVSKLPGDLAKYLAMGSMELNSSDSDMNSEAPQIFTMLLLHSIIILLTVVGNSLLIYVIMRNNQVIRRKRVTPVQMLMLHMCAADLLFALLTVVPTMAITWTVPVFYGPDFLCKTVKFMQVFPMYASSFLLVAISADRYQAICRPLASMRSNAYNRPSLYAGLAWTAGLFCASPQFYLFEKSDNDCMGNYTDPMQYTYYVIVFNSLVWLLPSAIAGYLYYCVCLAVWQSSSFGGSFRNEKKKKSGPLLGGMQVHHKGSTLQCVELDRRRIQTVKLTLTIVASHFVLWAPFCTISVVDALWPQVINPTLATYIMFLGNLNSCMNPWIWFYFNRTQLRRAIPCANMNRGDSSTRNTHTPATPMSSVRLLCQQGGGYASQIPVSNSMQQLLFNHLV